MLLSGIICISNHTMTGDFCQKYGVVFTLTVAKVRIKYELTKDT
jgi:hypothetical protein